MMPRDEEYQDLGDNEEKAEHPGEAEELAEGGRAFEDNPLIPGAGSDGGERPKPADRSKKS